MGCAAGGWQRLQSQAIRCRNSAAAPLEKKHVIIGHDTDALSNPFDADLKWVVKLDKPDYIGRRAHERMQAHAGNNRLVGFQSVNGGRPDDGMLVVIQGKLAGRITSVRFSPLLKKYVGLAWVPTEHSTVAPSSAFRSMAQCMPRW